MVGCSRSLLLSLSLSFSVTLPLFLSLFRSWQRENEWEPHDRERDEREKKKKKKCHSYRSALAISAMVWVNGSHFESIILAKNIHNLFRCTKFFKGSHEQMYFLIEGMRLFHIRIKNRWQNKNTLNNSFAKSKQIYICIYK